MWLRLPVVFVVLSLTASAPAPFPKPGKNPPPGPPASIEGVWSLVSVAKAGQLGATPKRLPIPMKAEIKAGQWTFVGIVDGTELALPSYALTLDTKKSPVWIDLKRTLVAASQVQGVIEVKGDTMRVLYAEPAAEGTRPTSFESRNPHHILMTFKRVK